ncbi:hypothetical protein CHS0354_003398 [Potamilus streckersoni]|uniref:Uncharacterized protein n=1 Tax=Potamilus streckersoni TaxID=2493646 RepID=A0AAE0VZC6_9BIVA|nr:hypothetical protein CHS0354_003398 [Potamilus streckersoni]
MTLSRVICIVLVCEMVAARYIGIPNYDIPRNLGLWFNQRQSDQRANMLPRYSGHVPFAYPGKMNHRGQPTANRHVTHLQQTVVLANNLHIQSPSALNSTGSGNEHGRLQNKVDSATNRSWIQTNTQQELNAYLQNKISNQSSHVQSRQFAEVEEKLTADNVARQNLGLSQRNSNKILISFQGASNIPLSNMGERHQASTEGESSPGRIFVKSRGTVNISHPRGMIEISRSHNGHSNVIINTNTRNTTPQREIPAEPSKYIPTTEIPDVDVVVTSKYASTAEEIEHEAP